MEEEEEDGDEDEEEGRERGGRGRRTRKERGQGGRQIDEPLLPTSRRLCTSTESASAEAVVLAPLLLVAVCISVLRPS